MSEGLNIQLDESELQEYNSKKRSEKELPKVYSTATSSSVPISRDMEAFLILEDFNFKNTISDSIKAILDEPTYDLEKELFEEACENEIEVVKNEVADLNSKLGTTAEVRNGLRSSKFVNVTDISELLTAISSGQNSLAIKQRLSQYRLNYLEQYKHKFQPGQVADQENRKAAKSWLNPLTAY